VSLHIAEDAPTPITHARSRRWRILTPGAEGVAVVLAVLVLGRDMTEVGLSRGRSYPLMTVDRALL
jgi:hypothetical protein